MNPILLSISFISGLIYSIYLDGRKSFRFNLLTILPISIFAALVNIAFNHNGMTILCYLPTGNPVTLESIIYGICAAVLLSNIIIWFFCFSRIITSDKFIYLFGKIIPSLSLVLSMIIRFIPLFKHQYQAVSTAQKTLTYNNKNNKITSKIKHSLNIFSIMLTWSLENSIITADSMNSRGYGLKGRTAFSNYKFYFRDGIALIILAALIITLIFLTHGGYANITFYPFYELNITGIGIVGYIIYAVLCILPMIINITEDMKWNYFRSKI